MAKKKKKGNVLGIDLGTWLSGVALYDADGKVELLPNLDGDTLTHSVVNLSDESHPVVGQAAVNQLAYAPEHTARLFKRVMGRTDAENNPIPAFVHPDSGKAYSPEEISSFVIRYLVESAKAATGHDVLGVVISVPAYFEDPARLATKRAGELAGVPVLRIVNEPTAGAVAFGLDKAEDGRFLAFDLGGGTFDVTIIEIAGPDFRALATVGDRDLGGADMDNLVASHVVERFKAETGVEITPESDLIVWQETLEKCERAKRDLSQASSASFMISAQGQRLVIDLTRDALNGLIVDIIEKTKEITERALAVAKLDHTAIDDVILIGGSTKVPAVQDMLTAMFGKKPRTDTNPSEAVAIGAAIFAARQGADQGLAVVDSEGHKVLPPVIKTVDVNSHALGCLALQKGIERHCVIVPAQTPLPANEKDVFALTDERQTGARVKVVQGPANALAEECTVIGEVVLDDLPTGPCEPRIEVTYGFTEDGILTVTATDTVSKKSTNGVIEGRAGVSSQNAGD